MEGAELTAPTLQGSGEVTSTHYMLSKGVHAMAEIPPTDTVLLWLGVSLPIQLTVTCQKSLQRTHIFCPPKDVAVYACKQ